MSRHRNVRNMIEDDYDDYYDDDYYDDDYDQNYSYSNKQSQQKIQQQKMQQQKMQQQKMQQQKMQKQKIQQQKMQLEGNQTIKIVCASGVVKAANKSSKPSISIVSGISKSALDWDKPPAVVVNREKSTNSVQQALVVGIKKPPVGWGKPSTKSLTTTSTDPTDSKSLPKASLTDGEKLRPKNNEKEKIKVPDILLDQGCSRSQLTMVVIGHVDAGKSTLMGQLLYQLGHVTKRQAQKISSVGNTAKNSSTKNNNSESSNSNNMIKWAWLLDEDTSEREHGITMEIATKTIKTDIHDIIILDAPGHADFIPMMITGAASADVGILVVDSSDFLTGFTNGQMKEHVILARGLGVSQLIVCINKLDSQKWSKEVFTTIKIKLLQFLTKIASFKPKRIQFIPTSGLTGINIIKENKNDNSGMDASNQYSLSLLRNWYKDLSLVEAINNFKPVNEKHRKLDKPLRFVINDVYADGKGIGVRGRVIQGFLKQGQKIIALPINDEATISGLSHLQVPQQQNQSLEKYNERLSYAIAGDTIDCVLLGIDDITRINVGNMICPLSINLRPRLAKIFRCKIYMMDKLNIPIIRGASILFHSHSLEIPAMFSKLIESTSRTISRKNNVGKEQQTKGKQTKNPRTITSGSSAVVELTLTTPICAESFNECEALSRFVLRRAGDTVAIGVIENIIA